MKVFSEWGKHPATITESHFKLKSLSNWAFNIAVGCNHGCTFCYVPSVSTNKLKLPLAEHGVTDPDAQWGDYVLLRKFDEQAFRASLRRAINQRDVVPKDGNEAIMFCTTTDPYQVFADREMNRKRNHMVRRALEIIRDESSLRVRILTRSPLAMTDVDLFKSFGNRLLFGMSIPTLNHQLARCYEPNAPDVRKRLVTLAKMADAGVPIYAAMAPTYPQCDPADIYNTMEALAELEPHTIFSEPINIRANNVGRIKENAKKVGLLDKYNWNWPWHDPQSTLEYQLTQLATVETAALHYHWSRDHIHLWPDASLGKSKLFPLHWREKYWQRISEWPE